MAQLTKQYKDAQIRLRGAIAALGGDVSLLPKDATVSVLVDRLKDAAKDVYRGAFTYHLDDCKGH